MTDAELLDAWRSGDRSAGGELFRRHLPAVHRFFDGKLSGAPDDLVQRTFLRCVEARDNVREAASFRAYLLAIARNELYMHFRRRAGSPARGDGGDDIGTTALVDLEPSPSQVAAANEDRRQLLVAMRRIPIDLQIAIELHYWEGFSASEAALVLDVPVGTMKTRIRRARELLRAALEDLGESPGQARATIDTALGTASS